MERVPGSARKTILVVDDDPHIVAVVVALLADSEYNVLTAESGSKALKQSRTFKGDIHLSLVRFPNAGNLRHRVGHGNDRRPFRT